MSQPFLVALDADGRLRTQSRKRWIRNVDVNSTDMPARIRSLPLCPKRNVPVPWFVDYIDGVPEFRAMNPEKRTLAVRTKLCWVCGEALGKYMTFVAGPMCGINRTSSEPPCHHECAQWSARNCPFLSKPQMTRREGGMEGSEVAAGHGIMRNPGVTLLWTCRSYTLFGDGMGGWLIQMGEPTGVEWWALSKPATRAQVQESIRTGLPALEAMAAEQEGAMNKLREMTKAFERFLPCS